MHSPKLSTSSDPFSSIKSQELLSLPPPDPHSDDRIATAQVIYSTAEPSEAGTAATATAAPVRTNLVGSPYKTMPLSNISFKEIKSANSSVYFTPNSKSLHQTPYRSTPLLTPPSSEERPPLPVFDAQSNSSADSSFGYDLPRQVPLTEQIMAQSAAYAQAIQRQQGVDGSSPSRVNSQSSAQIIAPAPTLPLPTGSGPGGLPQFSGSFATPNTANLATVPHLTYHQLQQQQQKQILNNQHLHQTQTQVQHSTPSPQNDVDVAPATQTYTPIDIPPGGLASGVATPKEIEVIQANMSATNSHGPKQIITIAKQDPLDNPHNTANVYINGLPLRYNDDDLYRLTRGFGAVKSVKMFTRHLEDKPSAYGFVLFNRIEDAERFIITLRQHTPFHPSFAKTGKVPGTTNAKHAISDPIIPVPTNQDYADISITGLPLTLDMQTLRALFSPQTIVQSRFFHTTGTPRRLVGFIRLENLQAAEDIIERLHGSSVLGWSEKLTVQIISSGANPQNYFTQHMPGLNNFPSLIDPIAPAAPLTQPSHGRFPSLGVYQHQNIALDDITNLFASMNVQSPQKRNPSFGSPGQGLSNSPQITTMGPRDSINPVLLQQLQELQMLRQSTWPPQQQSQPAAPPVFQGVLSTQSGGAFSASRPSMKVPGPIVTSPAPNENNVPNLLPALAPDSPTGTASQGSSPMTPIFQQLPRSSLEH